MRRPVDHPDDLGHSTTRYTEHGQDWLTCNRCGAAWSIVKCADTPSAPTYEDEEDFERVADGDGYCEENYETL